MSINRKSILIFGGGELQLSVIKKCKKLNLFTVVIDPNPDAEGENIADAFEIVDGDDFERTCSIIKKYSIEAIITAATDKPLVMMAKVAKSFNLKFFSEETAIISTDKFLMKKVFLQNNIPCAKGGLIKEINDSYIYPLILKPRDSSGSRGIIFCQTEQEANNGLAEAFSFSKKNTILIEEFIDGKEYSVEALHFNNQVEILQITEKITTPHPYNVELGHIQPTDLSEEEYLKIGELVDNIGIALKFQNCASHTELKINSKGIFVIETSPRLGGDFITSKLVPLSTGIDMEKALIAISLGMVPDINSDRKKASAIFYFDFNKKKVTNTSTLAKLIKEEGIEDLVFKLVEGNPIPKIKNSLDRYGHMILNCDNRSDLLVLANKYLTDIEANI